MKQRVENDSLRDFVFTDLVFGQEIGWLEEFTDRLKEEGLGVQWRASILPSQEMTSDLFRKLAAAGCTDLDFGIESCSDVANDNVNRPLTMTPVENALSWSAEAGIENHLNLMVGVPGEDESAVDSLTKLLKRNRDGIASIVSADVCATTPQSLLEQEPSRYGVVLPAGGHYLPWFHPTTRGHEQRLSWLVRLLKSIHGLEFPAPTGILTESARAAQDKCRCQEDGSLANEDATPAPDQQRQRHFRQSRLRSSGEARTVCGPAFLELDLTNNCNCDCIACWCHSRLLGNQRLRSDAKRRYLPYDATRRLLDQAWSLGVETVQLSGAGEPMLHPQFHDIVRHIKSLGMRIHLITNFTLVNEEAASFFVEQGLDHITASIWAGTSETYATTHPSSPPGTFEHLVQMMSVLRRKKRDQRTASPQLKVYNVILTRNCHELPAMVEMARRGFASEVEFAVVDVVPGKTDSLGLDEDHCRGILEQFESLRPDLDYPFPLGISHLQPLGQEKLVQELQEFGRMLHDLADGFHFDDGRGSPVCPRGQHGHFAFVDEDPGRFLRYEFDPTQCAGCPLKAECPVPGDDHRLDITFLSIRGAGSFSRRIADTMECSKADASLIDRFPCYVGWIYARIRSNGDLIPCCKAVDMPLGNALKDGLASVWFGRKMNEFRVRARDLPKSNPYFAPINCYQGCDNLGMNLSFHREVMGVMDGRAARGIGETADE